MSQNYGSPNSTDDATASSSNNSNREISQSVSHNQIDPITLERIDDLPLRRRVYLPCGSFFNCYDVLGLIQYFRNTPQPWQDPLSRRTLDRHDLEELSRVARTNNLELPKAPSANYGSFSTSMTVNLIVDDIKLCDYNGTTYNLADLFPLLFLLQDRHISKIVLLLKETIDYMATRSSLYFRLLAVAYLQLLNSIEAYLQLLQDHKQKPTRRALQLIRKELSGVQATDDLEVVYRKLIVTLSNKLSKKISQVQIDKLENVAQQLANINVPFLYGPLTSTEMAAFGRSLERLT